MRVLFAGLISMVSASLADTPAPPVPWVTTSENGQFFFKMVPPRTWFKIHREPYGTAYEVRENGDMVELWSTSGWYTFQAFLSNDGHFLVRMGPWSKGKEASKEHLALAFYQDGKLLNEYSTADLFKDKTAVRRTVSHYTWLAPEWISDVPPGWQSIHDSEAHLRLDHEDVFHLRTLEGTVFRFDCKSGKILERREEPDYRRALGIR